MKRKLLSALLVFAMVLTLLPVTAFAAAGGVNDLSGSIQIEKGTGKVTCSGTSGTSQKAIITSTDVSSTFGTKQSEEWDPETLDEETLKSDLSISEISTDLTAVQLTTANNNNFIVVIDLDAQSKVVGAGYKQITDLVQTS